MLRDEVDASRADRDVLLAGDAHHRAGNLPRIVGSASPGGAQLLEQGLAGAGVVQTFDGIIERMQRRLLASEDHAGRRMHAGRDQLGQLLRLACVP